MYTAILWFHIVVVLALVGVILVQRGRSGGLVEALGGVESIFGTKTSSFFVKAPVVLAVLFFATSISLAYLSKEQEQSLLSGYSAPAASGAPVQESAQPAQAAPASTAEGGATAPLEILAETGATSSEASGEPDTFELDLEPLDSEIVTE